MTSVTESFSPSKWPWTNCLEGAEHPFTVIIDHKNLQYLREARRLNPRQARWALFFTRFVFQVTYRAGGPKQQG